jgi:hypothetical protein
MSAERDDGLHRSLAAANPVDLAGLAGVADDARAREDLARILAQPRGRHVRARSVVSLAVVGVVLAAVLAFFATTGTFSSTSADATPLNILQRPATAQDQLPAWIKDNVTFKMFGVHPQTARLALSTPTWRYWVARAGSGARTETCLIDAIARAPLPRSSPGRPGGINCQRQGVFAQEFIVANMSFPPATTDTLSGVVPDGYTEVHVGNRTALVTNNVFVISAPPAPAITATGPAGSRTVWFFTWWAFAAPPAGPRHPLPFALYSLPPARPASLPTRIQQEIGPHQHAWALGVDPYGGCYWLVSSGHPNAPASFVVYGGLGSISGGPAAAPTREQPIVWFGVPHGAPAPYQPETNLIVGLTANGYTKASVLGRSVPIRHNAFVLGDVTSRSPVYVVITGPRGRLTAQLPSGADQYRGILQPPGKK